MEQLEQMAQLENLLNKIEEYININELDKYEIRSFNKLMKEINYTIKNIDKIMKGNYYMDKWLINHRLMYYTRLFNALKKEHKKTI